MLAVDPGVQGAVGNAVMMSLGEWYKIGSGRTEYGTVLTEMSSCRQEVSVNIRHKGILGHQ